MQKSRLSLNAANLKWIAIISMLIDHMAAVLVPTIMLLVLPKGDNLESAWDTWNRAYILLRGIGRIAFPLYAFMLVEGFYYTRNVWKYLGRLLVFSLISELPFNYAFSGGVWIDTSSRNVFFTLSIALLSMIGLKALSDKKEQLGIWNYPLSVGLIAVAFAIAQILNTDYGGYGVLLILVLYFFRDDKVVYRDIFYAVALSLIAANSSEIELVALLDIVLFHCYNRQKGKTISKYFFYLFYPIHLIILGLIRHLIMMA